MRKRQAWRYYCDFCKKAGCSGGHMAKHERGCVKNPGRVCGMCKIVRDETDEDERQQPIAELIAALEAGGVDGLRVLASNCPSCMLAAIVQLRLRDREKTATLVDNGAGDTFLQYDPEFPGFDFDYKAAVRNMWADVQAAQECPY